MTELRVPCISVNKENLQKWWPHIIKTLSESDFVAIDLVTIKTCIKIIF